MTFGPVVVEGLRLSNPLNSSHGHWSGPSAKRKNARAAVGWALLAASRAPGAKVPTPPWLVTVTRVAPRAIRDVHDNLPAACKSVVDEVCLFLKVDDGERDKVRFRYAQRAERRYAVEVRVEPAGDDP